MQKMANVKRFIDIGANLTDAMYTGVYNTSKKHEPDLLHVLKRSWEGGLSKIIVTGGSLEESKRALEIAETDAKLYSTVGCHPTRCLEFEQNPETYYDQLKSLAESGKPKVIAIGECGLDYERTQFCAVDIQQKYFEQQLKLSEELNLPLFLHCRKAADDLYEILSKYNNLKGVVHSFDGTYEEAQRFINLGYYIGLNGCSLKTKENLQTISLLPKQNILLETDSPWCEIRPSHAGYKLISKENQTIQSVKKEKWNPNCMVKSRNEPVNIRQVLDIVASVRGDDAAELSETIYNNTLRLFFPGNETRSS